MTAADNLIGQKFHRLTVVRMVRDKNNLIRWVCQCDCGGVNRGAMGALLKKGFLKSCGCLRSEVAKNRNQKGVNNFNYKHGESLNKKMNPEYRSWIAMKQRCLNPKSSGFKYYGGRGITICERWRNFENFLADMGRRPSLKHSIDRIDNNSNYAPDNCRWATPKEQSNWPRRQSRIKRNNHGQFSGITNE